MFVINLHTLETVNFLDFINDVVCQGMHAHQTQDIMRGRCTINNTLTPFDMLAFKYGNMPPFWDEFLMPLTLCIGDDQSLFTLGILAKADRTGGLGENGRFFRFARFKQISHAWQTTGNIASLEGFL